MAARSTVLDFTTDHSFYERAGDHDTLLVLFNYLDQPLSRRSHGPYVAGARCNRLYLHSGRNDWFQNGVPGVADSFEGLQQFCRDLPKRMTETHFLYAGHSMGAFAALGCGLFAEADRILASVPELDLGLPGSQSAAHLSPAQLRYPSLRPMLVDNRTTPIALLVGRHNEMDRRAALEIAAARPVSLIELDCGHEIFVHLRDSGLLASVFEAFVDGRELSTLSSRE